jgi:hypothetical protein
VGSPTMLGYSLRAELHCPHFRTNITIQRVYIKMAEKASYGCKCGRLTVQLCVSFYKQFFIFTHPLLSGQLVDFEWSGYSRFALAHNHTLTITRSQK